MCLATRPPKVFTVHAVLKMTLAHRVATVTVTQGSYIGVAALTRLGLRSNVVRTAEIVRDGSLGIEVFSSLTREAAIHSFSNVYHCAWKNGSAAGLWCCGAQEGTPESDAGCCDTTLFNASFPNKGFGNFFAPATELNISATNTSASSATQSVSSSGLVNPDPCSPGANLTAGQNAPISKPQQQSRERLATGLGVGVPLGVIAFGSLLLLFREHKLRLRAVSTAGIINDKRFNGGERRERALHDSEDHNAPQELEDERKYPNELDSQQVHEVAVHGAY